MASSGDLNTLKNESLNVCIVFDWSKISLHVAIAKVENPWAGKYEAINYSIDGKPVRNSIFKIFGVT